MSVKARIKGTGLFTPEHSISNEELVEAYNAFVDKWNGENPEAEKPLEKSSAEFIEKASGIKSRYVLRKDGVLDVNRMRPKIETRSNDELCHMAEIAVIAAKEAIENAGLTADDIDAVVCGASNLQRGYPAVAVEIQSALGIKGYGYDMNVACASAAFGIQNAIGHLATGARNVLMVNPEITSAHINYKDRDGHFIFGDVCTAVVIGQADGEAKADEWDIIDTRLWTEFSNNIRNNFGFMNAACDELIDLDEALTDKLFKQNGRSVFKEVVPAVAKLIAQHMADNDMPTDNIKRMWLHQANLNMNELISKKVMGREVTRVEAPVVLDEYANTSSAGCIIAFHKHRQGFEIGDIGVLSGFGAGYSAGSIIVRKAG